MEKELTLENLCKTKEEFDIVQTKLKRFPEKRIYLEQRLNEIPNEIKELPKEKSELEKQRDEITNHASNLQIGYHRNIATAQDVYENLLEVHRLLSFSPKIKRYSLDGVFSKQQMQDYQNTLSFLEIMDGDLKKVENISYRNEDKKKEVKLFLPQKTPPVFEKGLSFTKRGNNYIINDLAKRIRNGVMWTTAISGAFFGAGYLCADKCPNIFAGVVLSSPFFLISAGCSLVHLGEGFYKNPVKKCAEKIYERTQEAKKNYEFVYAQ